MLQVARKLLHELLDALIWLLSVSAICGTIWFLIVLMLEE